MFKKRISLLLVLVLTLSFMAFAAGCSSDSAEQTATTPAPTPTEQAAPEVNEDEILTQAAIDYFNYLQGNNLLDAEKVNEQLANFYVIDIRAAEDYAAGHITGSVNIPMAKIGAEIPNLPEDKTMIIVCYSGQTASQTVGVLRMAGFDAVALKGGFPSWEKAGFEIQK